MFFKDQHPIWKWVGVLLIVILAWLTLDWIVFPVIGFLSSFCWAIAGFFAFVFRIFAYVFLVVAAIIGILMLIAWIIRQFLE